MKLIVAVDEQWGIGKNGDLLLSIPDDMRYFREQTRRTVLVMGYNTLLSFPGGRPLPGRLNIVLNDAAGCAVEGAVVCDSIEQMLRLVAGMDTDRVFVIGGGSVYRQLLPYCDTAYITKMQFTGEADTFIPDLDAQPAWHVASGSEVKEHEGVRYSFVEYHNAAPKVAFGGGATDIVDYFQKKTEIVFDMVDCAEGDYRTALVQLLRAYFAPLHGGCTAEDVRRFLAAGVPFNDWLREQRLIAGIEDFALLGRLYDHSGGLPVHTVRVTPQELPRFEQLAADGNAARLIAEFAAR